mgnify:CR=1 FL=1
MKKIFKKLFNPKVEPMNKIFVHKKNLLHNLDYLQNLHRDAAIFPVLKSNAYWHGIAQVSKILNKTDVPYIAVDSFPEYQIVKSNTKKPILILGETISKNYKKFDLSRTTFCVYNIETISYLAKRHKKIKIHLFLDTGMHREWIDQNELINVLEFLQNHPKIHIEWVMSHLHSADQKENDWIQKQINLFKKMYHTIIDYGHNPIRRHIWNSAGIFKIDDNFFNAYRPWLSLYGYSPLSEDDLYFKMTQKLKPCLSIQSKIITSHTIWAEEWVSYNHTRKSDKWDTVAIVPFGYAEWLPRSASNEIFFKHKNTFLPQIGTICMNLCTIEWNQDISVWDDIEIIWLEWKNSISELQKKSDRIIYEILVWLDKSIRRELI